jgi:hypothetical protein
MKFVSEPIDLTLEFVGMETGKEFTLTPKVKLNSLEVDRILNAWTKVETGGELSRVGVLAEELALLYPMEAEDFLKECPPGMLQEMVTFVAEGMVGFKKNGKK